MKIEDFYAMPKKVTILGSEVELMPITAKYFPLIFKARVSKDINEKINATSELAFITLKQIFPNATKEDFDKLSTQALGEILDAFWKVNSDSEEQDAVELLKKSTEEKEGTELAEVKNE